MKKTYRIVGDWTEEDVLFLSKFGIETSCGFKSINVEDGETYQHIHARFSKGKHCFECFGYDNFIIIEN